MGIFSKTTKDTAMTESEQRSAAARADQDAVLRETDGTGDAPASNVETISPLTLKLQEQQRKLDGLKGRIGSLNRAFEQIGALAVESGTSVSSLSEFIDVSRTQVETEVRLKSENAKLTTNLLDLTHQVDSLTTRLEESTSEIHALRKRGLETRTALETSRNDIVSIRDNNKKINDQYRQQSTKLLDSNTQLASLSDAHSDLQARFHSIEDHAESLKSELDSLTKRESEVQQNLSESVALLDEELKKNKDLTSTLESSKRELSETKNENIDLGSKLDVSSQELEYNKSRLEEEQRKHDNQIYSLNSEIKNLTSQRRIGAQSLQDMSAENKKFKERNRDLMRRLQEIEQLLDAGQKNQEVDRNDLLNTNSKLHELNVRYNAMLTDLNQEKKQNERYKENISALMSDNQKLQHFKIKYDSAEDQIRELKALIGSYQISFDESVSVVHEPAVEDDLPAEIADADIADTDAKDGEKKDGDDSVVIKLRD